MQVVWRRTFLRSQGSNQEHNFSNFLSPTVKSQIYYPLIKGEVTLQCIIQSVLFSMKWRQKVADFVVDFLGRLDFRRLPGPVLIMSAGSFSRTAAGNRAYFLGLFNN